MESNKKAPIKSDLSTSTISQTEITQDLGSGHTKGLLYDRFDFTDLEDAPEYGNWPKLRYDDPAFKKGGK